MAETRRLQFRIPEDEAEILEQHAEENELSKSVTLRRGMRKHLADEGYDMPVADGGATEQELENIQAEVKQTRTSVKNVQTELQQTQSEVQQTRNGIFASVVYLIVVVLAPSTLAVTVFLTVLGLMLAVGLWYGGVFDGATLTKG